MIGVRVGNEGTRFRVPWIQPQVGLRQIKAAMESNFEQTDRWLQDFPASAKANRVGNER
jgi:hypothetical protein